MKGKFLFVFNPKSNEEGEKELKEAISEQEKNYSFSWKIYATTGDRDNTKIKSLINNFKPDTIVAAGGDGTVNLVASLILNSDIKLGIIPEGSANGLAFNLNIPNNTKDALKKILQSEAKPIDIIQINKKYNCLHLSDIGINARIVKRFEEESSKGLAGYGKQMLKELFAGKSAFSFQIETPAQKEKCKSEMLVIANAKSFGTGAIINPKGEINDGKFEIVILKPYPWWIMFSLPVMFFTGRLHKMKYVRVISTSNAKVKLNEPHDLQVDGEIISNIDKLDLKILKHSLNVIY